MHDVIPAAGSDKRATVRLLQVRETLAGYVQRTRSCQRQGNNLRCGIVRRAAHAARGNAIVRLALLPVRTLAVQDLDRTGRRASEHPVAGFRSLTDQIDTTTSDATLIFDVSGALAEFERDITRKRTHEGLRAARTCGRVVGVRKAPDTKTLTLAKRLHKDSRTYISTICQTLGISRSTHYRFIECGKNLLEWPQQVGSMEGKSRVPLSDLRTQTVGRKWASWDGALAAGRSDDCEANVPATRSAQRRDRIRAGPSRQ